MSGTIQQVYGVSGVMLQTMTPDPVLRYTAVSSIHCLNQWHVSWVDEYDSHREGQTFSH